MAKVSDGRASVPDGGVRQPDNFEYTMSQMNRVCKGTTRKGKNCKLRPLEGLDFCHHHVPEEVKVEKFVQDHKEAIIGFIAGAIADPIAGDLYDFFKEKLGMKHLVPPIIENDKFAQLPSKKIRQIRQAYISSKDISYLEKLIPMLDLHMSEIEVKNLLGAPNHTQVTKQDIDLSTTYITYTYFADIIDNTPGLRQLPHYVLKLDFNKRSMLLQKITFFITS